MAGGRPTKYKPEYCQMLIDHMKDGYSYETFGAIISVAKQTIYNWEKEFPEFLDAKRDAFQQCQLFWEKTGMGGMYMGGKDNPFQASIWVFNMKNRFNWTDKKEVKEDSTQTITLGYKLDDDEDDNRA